MTMEVLDFTSKVTDNLLRVAESFRIDAANREEAPKHEALAREQCQHQYAERQRQQAEEKEKNLRQEASEREQRQAREALDQEQEAAKREQNLLRDAALREERLQKEAQAQRSNAFAREEVLLRTRAEAEQHNLTQERAYIDAELKRKQVDISANSEIEKQRIEADVGTQISHIEAMERREAEFMVEKTKEKEFVTTEMQARMQLERELAEERQKNLKLEYEAKTRWLERELKEKRLPTIKESESGEIACTVHDRLRGTLETYTSKIARPVQGRGTFDEPALGIHGAPRVLNPVLPEMLPPVPTFTPGMTGPKPIVTAGMLPTVGVTLLPLASFRTLTPASSVEPLPLTRGLVTATHLVPSVPVSYTHLTLPTIYSV